MGKKTKIDDVKKTSKEILRKGKTLAAVKKVLKTLGLTAISISAYGYNGIKRICIAKFRGKEIIVHVKAKKKS